MTKIDWSQVSKHRQKLYLLNIPIKKSNSGEPGELFNEYLKKGDVVLDVGSGPTLAWYKSKFPQVTYRGLEIDKKFKADYRGFKEVKSNSVDVVLMISVIEHLSIEQARVYAREIKRVLKPRGLFVIATHNVFAIPNLQEYDITHVQHYPIADLYALLEEEGFKLFKAYRVLDNRGLRKIRNLFKRILCQYILGVDYAWAIQLAVQKP